MITDTCIGVVINTGIHNIEILILDNSKAQDIDKAQIEANKDYKMASNINNSIKNENICYKDDTQNHLLHTCYQHLENDNKQGIIHHPDNYINFNNANQGT